MKLRTTMASGLGASLMLLACGAPPPAKRATASRPGPVPATAPSPAAKRPSPRQADTARAVPPRSAPPRAKRRRPNDQAAPRSPSAIGGLFDDQPSSRPASPRETAEKYMHIDWRVTWLRGLQPPATFAAAQRIAFRTIYKDHRETFLCGCGYTPRQQVTPARCGYKPRTANARSRRIAWMRIVPVAAFGQHRPCWKRRDCKARAGRRIAGLPCCEATDPEFRRMANDLQNLVPMLAELGRDRADYPFAELPGARRAYGACRVAVDRTRRVVTPPPRRRGEIARAYLYLYRTYPGGLPLTKAQVRRFLAWHLADPPDAWDKERERRITAIQGGGNPLVQ